MTHEEAIKNINALNAVCCEKVYMNNNYPNLMCFGNEPYKCNFQESCPNYKECKENYHEKWFSMQKGE